MDHKEFSLFRKKFNKTQKELSQLLGISLKAVHSYEQGWRNIPPHIERQMFFLAKNLQDSQKGDQPCWAVKNCAPEIRERCPAWEFRSGNLCWFVCGTVCGNEIHDTWEEKMKQCRTCEVLAPVFKVLNND